MRFHWRIRHKLTAGLILVIGITALLSAGSLYGLRSYRRSNKVYGDHLRQQELLGYLQEAVGGLSFPSRELLLSNTDLNKARQEKLRKLQPIEDMLEKCRNSQIDDEKKLVLIEEIQKHLYDLKSSVTTTQPRAGAMKARPIWFQVHERDIISDLIHSLGRLRGVIHTDITRYQEADRSNYRASLAVVYSTSVLVLVLLVVLVWLGYQAIFQPISELYRGVTKLAGGDFDSRVRVETGDEMQELGESFNVMADRLQGIYKDLNQLVEVRSRQLIRSERLASVGFLAAGVAHEINNPLASIAFSSEALQSRLGELLSNESEDSDVVKNYLQMIQQESFRCKNITEKLLDFSRVGNPERVRTDLVGLTRSVIEMVQHLGRTTDKNLIFEPDEPISAKVNPQELKQVLLNLIINGLESIDAGGTVTVKAKSEESTVSITVHDDGCGMTQEIRENLFEPFFTRNRTGKGTGLGLSISHLIIDQHGGTLDAHSLGPDQGSIFTIQLPQESKSNESGSEPESADAA